MPTGLAVRFVYLRAEGGSENIGQVAQASLHCILLSMIGHQPCSWEELTGPRPPLRPGLSLQELVAQLGLEPPDEHSAVLEDGQIDDPWTTTWGPMVGLMLNLLMLLLMQGGSSMKAGLRTPKIRRPCRST